MTSNETISSHVLIWAQGWLKASVENMARRLSLTPVCVDNLEGAKKTLDPQSTMIEGLKVVASVILIEVATAADKTDEADEANKLAHAISELRKAKPSLSFVLLLGPQEAKNILPEGFDMTDVKWVREGDLDRVDVILRDASPTHQLTAVADTNRKMPVEVLQINDAENVSKLGGEVRTALAEFSASIHMNQEMRRRNYVQVLLDEDKSNKSEEEGKLEKGEESDRQRFWNNYRQWASKYNRLPIAHQVDPHNALVRFTELLGVPNRQTFVLRGEQGCGKTTFLHECFDGYFEANRNAFKRPFVYFFIDFLRYDFVQDAQDILLPLQRAIFDHLLTHGTLPPAYAELHSFDEFLNSKTYAPTALLDMDEVPETVNLLDGTNYLRHVLTNAEDSDLKELHYRIVGDYPPNHEALMIWLHQLRSRSQPRDICRTVCYFAQQSVMRIKQKIAEDILFHAQSMPDIHDDLTKVGMNLETLAPPPRLSKIEAVRNLLNLLCQTKDVFLVIDNSDRTRFPEVERRIFAAAWEFLPPNNYKSNVKLVIAIRPETYMIHEQRLVMLHEQHLRSYDNVANLHASKLVPPLFVDLAKARLRDIISKLRAENEGDRVEILENFVLPILLSQEVGDLFRRLYASDMRGAFVAFENACLSPHMAHTNLYFRAHQVLQTGSPRKEMNPYVPAHRLLTSLVLGEERIFRQGQTQLLLNVYHARLTNPTWPWQQTLALPRALTYLSRCNGVALSKFKTFFEDTGKYSANHVQQLLDRLRLFGLIHPFVDRIVGSENGDGARLELTPRGNYYADDLIYRLEYLQLVYGDMLIPQNMIFREYDVVLNLADLDDFRDAACRFIAMEERAERVEALMFTDDFINDLKINPPSFKIRQVTDDQLWRIYYTANRRPK